MWSCATWPRNRPARRWGRARISHPSLRAGLSPLAFVLDGTLRSVALQQCRSETLVGGGVQAPIRYSADGRWVGYGTGTVIAAGGGQVERPLGATAVQAPGTWAWSPQGDTMAGITRSGAIVVGQPGRLPERIEPPDWGASQILFSGPQTLVVGPRRRHLDDPARRGRAAHHLQSARTAASSCASRSLSRLRDLLAAPVRIDQRRRRRGPAVGGPGRGRLGDRVGLSGRRGSRERCRLWPRHRRGHRRGPERSTRSAGRRLL